MSEHISPHDSTTFDRSFSGLSSTVRTIASEVVPPRDRSVPASLCTIAGEVAATTVSDHDVGAAIETGTDTDADANTAFTYDEREGRPDEILAAVGDAVALLEGYVQLRTDLLHGDRYADRNRRDAAVLASDHLHAAAYTTITEAPVPDRRSLELYRGLAAGSSALAEGFTAWPAVGNESADVDGDAADARGRRLTDEPIHPRAVLAETAATLGATAVGAADETRSALEAYARSLSTALCRVAAPALESDSDPDSASGAALSAAAISDATSDGVDPRETVARVLSGRSNATASVGRNDTTGTDTDTSPAIARHLERARDALSALENRSEAGPVEEKGEAADDGEAATATGSASEPGAGAETDTATPSRSPLVRLERATRIPFADEG